MIAILGSGAFGTALGVSLASRGAPVLLWTRREEQAEGMQKQRCNAQRLPGVTLPESLSVTADVAQVRAASTLLLAVPMQQLAALLTRFERPLKGKSLVACCKGIDLRSGEGPVAILRKHAPDSIAAILTGPSFAHDIAIGLPTALTLACQDAETGKALQQTLTTPNLRIYRTSDTIGAELGGALKNVMAIACGAAIGAGLGESARAALMTRGYAEMLRMAVALGAGPETLAGLSGFGDLTLTCTSEQSRNTRFGMALGRDESFDANITVEGAATARAVQARAARLDLEMPIVDAVVALLDGRLKVAQAMEQLLARPLKEE